MKVPRYTLRELFLMTTLIAVGVGGIVTSMQLSLLNHRYFWLRLAVVLSSGAMIGVGVGTPLHKKALVGLLGFVVAAICVMGAALQLSFPDMN